MLKRKHKLSIILFSVALLFSLFTVNLGNFKNLGIITYPYMSDFVKITPFNFPL